MEQYFGSYLLPLLEETQAAMHSSVEIIARAPYTKVTYLNVYTSHETLFMMWMLITGEIEIIRRNHTKHCLMMFS